jgi:subtilase family serine protease
MKIGLLLVMALLLMNRIAVPEISAFEEESFDMVLSLKIQNREELDRLISELHDPNSSNYRHWLTPDQFGERFGVSQSDYQRI